MRWYMLALLGLLGAMTVPGGWAFAEPQDRAVRIPAQLATAVGVLDDVELSQLKGSCNKFVRGYTENNCNTAGLGCHFDDPYYYYYETDGYHEYCKSQSTGYDHCYVVENGSACGYRRHCGTSSTCETLKCDDDWVWYGGRDTAMLYTD